MNICIYSPYFPNHIGGGEKYLLDVALAFQKHHTVSLAVSSKDELSKDQVNKYKKRYQDFIGSSLSKISFIATPIGTKASFITKTFWTKQFDCMYYATDGSQFFSLTKKNILHIQVPFTDTKSSFARIKLKNWHVKNTNSSFTKQVIEQFWKTKVDVVHHPMIADDMFIDLETGFEKKEKIILNVGRFFRQLHSKRQDILVDTFIELQKKYPKKSKDWKLVCIGTIEDNEYFNEVQTKAKGQNISILTDISRGELIEWYQKAAIYWHATGYSVDQNIHPEKVEHFGISTVEAMAAGCVPVVINKGGQPEVLGNDLKQLLWNSTNECLSNTASLLSNDELLLSTQKKSIKRAKQFTQPFFEKKLYQMLEQ